VSFAPTHKVTVIVDGQRIEGWTSYEISSSMLDPVDSFTLTRPFDDDLMELFDTDTVVTVMIDGVPIVTGPIDTNEDDHTREASTLTIGGRDWVGRLVQESAPHVSFDGLDFVEVVERLADPWYTAVDLSDARNRLVRLGKKGRKAAAAGEALVLRVKKKTWQVEPGQTRWQIMNKLASEAGYMIWAAVDGRSLVIGQPNYKQGVQFLITKTRSGSSIPTTTSKLRMRKSVADRFSLVMALGSGRGDAANYGESTTSRRDVVRDGPGVDGVGRDFLKPKRLILAERTLLNIAEARQHATNEKNRRDFERFAIAATMPGHGQNLGVGRGVPLFAPNTVARVINEPRGFNELCLIHTCRYSGSRTNESTDIEAVPSGTVFVQ
jgi:prophage tail gpP-like protein